MEFPPLDNKLAHAFYLFEMLVENLFLLTEKRYKLAGWEETNYTMARKAFHFLFEARPELNEDNKNA